VAQKSLKNLSTIAWVAVVLVVIGALNWGLVGLFSFNLVAAIFGAGSALSRIIYVLVAIAGIYLIATFPRIQRPARPA
jgi:uncharacterized membrane protein YuzA (DUF378 family)